MKGPKSHHVWIKNFNRLLYDQTKYHGRKYFCERCLHGYTTEYLLQRQWNGIGDKAIRIEMPVESKNKLRFINFYKKMKVPFVIYADFEALIKKIDDHGRTNVVCGYAYTVVRWDGQP